MEAFPLFSHNFDYKPFLVYNYDLLYPKAKLSDFKDRVIDILYSLSDFH